MRTDWIKPKEADTKRYGQSTGGGGRIKDREK